MVKFVLIGGWFNYTSHEYGHLVTARLLGYSAEIKSTGLNMTYITWGGAHSNISSLLFYMSGGLVSGMVAHVMSWKNDDHEARILWSMLALFNFIYGVVEGIAPKQFWNIGWMAGFSVAWMFFIWVLITKKPDILVPR